MKGGYGTRKAAEGAKKSARTKGARKARPRSPPAAMLVSACSPNASTVTMAPASQQHMGGRSLGRRKVRHHVNPLKSRKHHGA